MRDFATLGKRRAVLGMIHLQPLPGTPFYKEGSFNQILDTAVQSARALYDGGADGCLVQTVDRIYSVKDESDPARTTLMPEQLKNLGIPQNDPKNYLKFYQEVTNDVRGLPWTVNYVEWHTIVQNEILTPIAKGEKSAQEAVSNVAPKVNAILARK